MNLLEMVFSFVFGYDFKELLAIPVEFLLSYARYCSHLFRGVGKTAGKLFESIVMKHDIGGKGVLAGDPSPERAQFLPQVNADILRAGWINPSAPSFTPPSSPSPVSPSQRRHLCEGGKNLRPATMSGIGGTS